MKVRLTVKKAQTGDVGSDVVRVAKNDRGDIPRWKVACIACNGQRKRVIVLGQPNAGEIWMDLDLRDDLDVEEGSAYEFEIRPIGCIGQVIMLATSRNPVVQTPMLIALTSLLISVLPLLLPLIGPCARLIRNHISHFFSLINGFIGGLGS
ncbi:hypothetical protein EL18_01536 [Nitratireductor basaltis]|uniref:Uncharacterized protein n=1 Tax=Nitratireductor basaltis TaxID=472175 RepID=A0A084UC15_9HYPH|nr:hypothetical protein EL18_01536 [Nitratireductor basaltis]